MILKVPLSYNLGFWMKLFRWLANEKKTDPSMHAAF